MSSKDFANDSFHVPMIPFKFKKIYNFISFDCDCKDLETFDPPPTLFFQLLLMFEHAEVQITSSKQTGLNFTATSHILSFVTPTKYLFRIAPTRDFPRLIRWCFQ